MAKQHKHGRQSKINVISDLKQITCWYIIRVLSFTPYYSPFSVFLCQRANVTPKKKLICPSPNSNFALNLRDKNAFRNTSKCCNLSIWVLKICLIQF